MRAALFEAPGHARIRDLAPPTPAPGELLVRVLACGVCGSDLNAWRGVPGIEYPLPMGAPGHEVWGEVTEMGPLSQASPLAVGQRVSGLVQNGYRQYALARVDELL